MSDKFLQDKYDALRMCHLDNIDISLILSQKGKRQAKKSATLSDHLGSFFDDDSTSKILMDEAAKVKLIELFSTFAIDFSPLPLNENTEYDVESESRIKDSLAAVNDQLESIRPNLQASHKWDAIESKMKAATSSYDEARNSYRSALSEFYKIKQKRIDLFKKAFDHISSKIDQIYKELTMVSDLKIGGTAYLSLENNDEPYLEGIRFNAMPPLKRFRDMEQLSGGEKSMAALALIFAIQR